jgi:hypothetical protein
MILWNDENDDDWSKPLTPLQWWVAPILFAWVLSPIWLPVIDKWLAGGAQ